MADSEKIQSPLPPPGAVAAAQLAGLRPKMSKAESLEREVETADTDENKRARRLKRVQRLSKAGYLGARLAGRGDLADLFSLSAGAAGGFREPDEERAGALRKVGGNVAGMSAARLAQKGVPLTGAGKKLGRVGERLRSERLKKVGESLKKKEEFKLSRNKAAALGGGISATIQGEGVIGIAKNSLSWYLLNIAFGSLWTIIGFIPALLYLDFHYLMSILGSKIFGSLLWWQRMVLATANILALVGLLLIIALFYAAYGYFCSGISGIVCDLPGWVIELFSWVI